MRHIALTALLLPIAVTGHAADSKFQIGAGFNGQLAWASQAETNSSLVREYSVNSTGVYFNGRYVVNNNIAFDANLVWSPSAQVEKLQSTHLSTTSTLNDIDGFSSTEANANFLVGLSLYRRGWYGFTGVGVFQERWKYTGGSYNFAGFQVPLGVGYNFKNLSIEVQIGIKNNDDYAEFFRDNYQLTSFDSTASWGKIGVLANF